MTARGAGAIVLLLLLAAPATALACPVCFDANEQNREAFILTTVLLSSLPLLMVGGVASWIRARTRGS